jgi:hypothetical protein
MSARNLYHDAVVDALVADGWTITDDPLRLSYGGKDVFVDLAAEQGAIGAEKGGRRIAVEIHSFLLPSPVRDPQEAVGQYEIYRAVLGRMQPDRVLYLAIPQRVHEGLLAERFGQLIVESVKLRIIVFDHQLRSIVKWIG